MSGTLTSTPSLIRLFFKKKKNRKQNFFILFRLSPLWLIFFGCTISSDSPFETWEVYQGDPGRNQYSALKQINKTNVNQLRIAWTFHTGDVWGGQSQIQCNAIVVDGILYGTSPKIKVFALNAATGELIWEFDPTADMHFGLNVNRGVTYWESGNDKRILFTVGSLLIAINAETGEPVKSFGAQGVVSLKMGLGKRALDLYVVSTTPGVVYKDLMIIGTRVSEGPDAAPGHIRAYDVKTGKVAWIFHTIPRPGEHGYETWPENAHKKIGGANAWAGMSLDEMRGIVYVPTGSASFDFWGGNRKGKNLFGNSIIALNAATGERIWHYQTIHHDLWDRDLPAPPNLVTVEHRGIKISAVAQITKSGFVFLLDRDTGEPLFEVAERPVKQSDLQGEQAWPNQPFPLKPPPFARQTFREKDITNISQEAHHYVKSIWQQTRSGEQFIPPSTEGTMIFPGFDGGGEWGGASFDPHSGVLYVNSNEMPWILTMVDLLDDTSAQVGAISVTTVGKRIYKRNCAICHGQERQGNVTGNYPPLVGLETKLSNEEIVAVINNGKGFMPSFRQISQRKKDALLAFLLDQQDASDFDLIGLDLDDYGIPYSHTGYNRFLDQEGYPAVKPPWGTLNAIDLNRGEILWQVPLGEFEELTQRGIPKTGTENYGGPVATGGGLIFIGATKDEYFRAFDKNTGEELWQYKLPSGGYATPSVYEVDGRQFVVIACGGGKMGTKPGDTYVAFSLPEE